MSRTPAAKPLYETKLPKSGLGKSWAPEIYASARRLGTPLMPWQQKAARLIGARRKDGRPRYKTVLVTVPRQQGKTRITRAAIDARARQEPYLELYGTAQSRQYAAKHVVGLGDELLRSAPPSERAGLDVKRGVGNERVVWPNGTVYRPLSPTESGGHGDSIDFMLVDEGWALEAHVMGGIRPAMIARPNSQLVVISTMGTLDSHVWNRLVARGRESVEDPDSDMAYLEYAAEDESWVFDESKWHRWMPALGRTVTVEDVRQAIADLEPAEAIRAFGNITTASLASIFPDEWVEAAWRVITPSERIVVSVEVNDEPAGATVATGHLAPDPTEKEPDRVVSAGRVIEWRPGSPRWVPQLVAKMIRERTVEAVVIDAKGPAREIWPELNGLCEQEYVPIVDRIPKDLGADTARFYNGLRDGIVVLEKAQPLAEAITRAARKQVGDMWLVSRRQMTVDASPLIAVIMATGVARELGVTPRVDPFIY